MTDQIYDTDFKVWIFQTISYLKNREFESLDVDLLIEELMDFGKSERFF
jgi:hypothetical protein